MVKPKERRVRRRIPPALIEGDDALGIPLTQGLTAWISFEDRAVVQNHVWYAERHGHTFRYGTVGEDSTDRHRERSGDLYAHLGAYNVVSLDAPFTPERYVEATGRGRSSIDIDASQGIGGDPTPDIKRQWRAPEKSDH